MNENVKNLIREITRGDITRMRQAALSVLKDDRSEKDRAFREIMLEKLEETSSTVEIPKEISTFVTMEDTKKTFIENRYFLTERERGLVTNIVRADKVNHLLTDKRVRYLNATLLHGESGTGKTTFGRYLAHVLDIPFVYLNFSQLINSYLGATGKNIQTVFDFVKQHRCVFMLDELDAIGSKRGQEHESGEMSRIVISLLQALDQLGNNIIVLGATNRFDIIDDAIKRRFTRNHEIKRLTRHEKIAFGKAYLSDCGYSLSGLDVANILSDVEKQSDIENNLIRYIIDREIEGLTEA